MALVATMQLLQKAMRDGGAVGAFNVIGLEHAQAIVEAAEQEGAPAVLQLSEHSVRHNLDGLEVIAAACRAMAETRDVDLALHLDHATSVALCRRAIAAGFGSVMFDGSSLPLLDNVKATREVVQLAHEHGVGVEAELGVVGGKEVLETSRAEKTDPAEAAAFVEATSIDALAVAIGTTHYMTRRDTYLDLDLLERLRGEVEVPLVLHGASGVSDSDLRAAIDRGINKINIATQLNKAFTATLRNELIAQPYLVDPRRALTLARDAMIEVVRHYLRMLKGQEAR